MELNVALSEMSWTYEYNNTAVSGDTLQALVSFFP